MAQNKCSINFSYHYYYYHRYNYHWLETMHLIQFPAAWQSYGQSLTFTTLLMFFNIFKKEEMPAFLGKH